LQYSKDNKNWITLVDQTANEEDLTHQYHSFKTPVKARYFKVTNYRVPDGTFAISGFRIFGLGNSKRPTKVNSFEATRDTADSRNITLRWKKQLNATGYNIRFGAIKENLNRVYQVYNDTTLTIRSLNKDQKYWFAIDAFGENGVTKGSTK
jgi:hypothetical protein